jgi:enamine deaminase RidA (YjgF/YER057c/UK114 family)
MPSKTYLNPDTMSQPRGFSHVVKVGNTAYIAGQVSAARDGSVVGNAHLSGDVSSVADFDHVAIAARLRHGVGIQVCFAGHTGSFLA